MTFAHPHFAEPRWLWLAVLGPLMLLALQRYSAWARGRQLAQLAAQHFLADLVRSHSPLRRAAKNAVLVISVCAIGLALARPQWGEQANTGRTFGQDVVFVLDCSRSMLASDVMPSRLQRAKLAILDFVQRRGRGRVGLVAFSGQAFLQCPLTFDYGAFQEALTITDGDDLEKGGVKMAEDLAKLRVVVFTIGVGTAAGAEIQIVNEQGKPELLRDANGEVVRSRLDEATLRAIAQATRGAYYPLGPLGEGLAKVRIAAESLNQTAGAQPGRRLGVDRFHLPLAGALVLLVAESLIGTRRRIRPTSS